MTPSLRPMGGTEIMADRILKVIPAHVAENVNIVHGSPDVALDPAKINIFVAHDLPTDKGVFDYFKQTGFTAYDAIVCVSYWQRDLFGYNGFPVEKMHVIHNFIYPVANNPQRLNPKVTKFIYTPTPHRGLQELVEAFEKLCDCHENVHLDVYSSFALYGRPEDDQVFATTFDKIKANNKITLYGTVPNLQIRDALRQADCFVYPAKWHETSCLCLIEAMSAGIDCLHTAYAALSETSGGLTNIIPSRVHGYSREVNQELVQATFKSMKHYHENKFGDTYYHKRPLMQKRANYVYGPEVAGNKWVSLIQELQETKNGKSTD